MDLDDIFDNGRKRRHHNSDHHYSQHEYRSDSHHDNRHEYHDGHHDRHRNDMGQMLIEKLRNNPQLKQTIIIGAVIVFVILIVAAIFLIPMLMKLLHFVAQNGVQGLVDVIWNGTK